MLSKHRDLYENSMIYVSLFVIHMNEDANERLVDYKNESKNSDLQGLKPAFSP